MVVFGDASKRSVPCRGTALAPRGSDRSIPRTKNAKRFGMNEPELDRRLFSGERQLACGRPGTAHEEVRVESADTETHTPRTKAKHCPKRNYSISPLRN